MDATCLKVNRARHKYCEPTIMRVLLVVIIVGREGEKAITEPLLEKGKAAQQHQ
jgi:hypothetical protein